MNPSNAYYSRIKGLFIPDSALPAIEGNINTYIDRIGGYTERLEDSFGKNDMPAVISILESILQLLESVYAKQCEANALVLLRSAKNNTMVYSQKLLSQSIADFLLLSIDMQKAQYLGTSKALKYRKVEKNEDAARSLAAVGRLLETGAYDKAKSIVNDMKAVESTFVKLGAMLEKHEYDRAIELAGTMENEHIGHINRGVAAKTLKKVLAVDDRPEILTSVSAALREHYKVFGAPGGKVALEIMELQDIDLFFLDIDMPEMDGFELAQLIRAKKKYENTPILFLTGNSSRDHILRAIRLGSNDFIVKPARNLTLLTKARKYMD